MDIETAKTTIVFSGGTWSSRVHADLDNIEVFYAAAKYSWMVLNTGVEHILDGRFGCVERIAETLAKRVPEIPFIKVRRGCIVRLDSITKVEKAFDGPVNVTMKCGYTVRVSRRFVAAVRLSVNEYKAKAACNLQGEPNGCQENQV